MLVVALLAVAGCGGDSETADRPDAPLVAGLGDSITAGAPAWSPNPARRKAIGQPDPASQWQHWAERASRGGFRFRNCGVEGERTDEIELRLEECAEDAQAVVVQGGTNDIVQNRPPSAAAANIREMVRRARGEDLRVLVATVPPINLRHPRWAREVRRLNRLIRALGREEGVPVIDFFALLEDPRRPDRLPPEWTDDGVHPTVAGYERLGRAAARVLAR